MGNSNGNLADYWHAFETTPGLQGGFIWEFWDHGILQRLATGGRPAGRRGSRAGVGRRGLPPQGYRWAYGGDFGDVPNDGNFVADGMVFPDRTPKPAMLEHRALAAPVRPGAGATATPGRSCSRTGRTSATSRGWRRRWRIDADGPGRQPGARRRRDALPRPAAGRRRDHGDRGAGGAARAGSGEQAAAGRGGDAGRCDCRGRGDSPRAAARRGRRRRRRPARPERRDLLTRAGAAPGRTAIRGDLVDGDGLLAAPGARRGAAARPVARADRQRPDRRVGAGAGRELGLDRLERRLVGVDGAATARIVVTADVVTGAGHVVRHVQTLTPLDGGVLVEELAVLPPELDDVPRVGTVLEVGARRRDGRRAAVRRGPVRELPRPAARPSIALHRSPSSTSCSRPTSGRRRAAGGTASAGSRSGDRVGDEVVDGRASRSRSTRRSSSTSTSRGR